MKLKNISCLITTLVMLFISNIIVLAEEAPPYTREEAYNAVFAELDVDADGEIDENLDKLIRKYDMDCIDPHLLKKDDYILFFNVFWDNEEKNTEESSWPETLDDFVYDYFLGISDTFYEAATSNGRTHGEVLKEFYSQLEGMGYDVSVNRDIHANDEFYNLTSKEKAESLEKQYSRTAVEETTTVVKKMVNDNGGDFTEAATLSYANKTKTTETAQKSSVSTIFIAVSILLGLGIAVYAMVSNKKK